MSDQAETRKSIIIDGDLMPGALDEQMIHEVVHSFYDAIRRDSLIGPIFTQAIAPHDWPRHLAKMCDFWSGTLLRTQRYDGRPLPPHLAIPGLGEEHFRRWLSLFRETVIRLCPPEVARLFLVRAFRIAHSFRLAIAFNRGEDSIAIAPITEQQVIDATRSQEEG